MHCYNIMTVIVNNRIKNAVRLQEVLTESGCIIKTRIGLHEAGEACTNDGLIILQLAGSDEEIASLEKSLNSIKGTKAKNMQICSEW